MTAAYKKSGPSQFETPLEDLRILPEHMFAKIGGFDVHFKKDGQVDARKSYSNVGIASLHDEGGRTSEKKELIKEVEVKLTLGVASLPPNVLFMNERIHANFKIGGAKRSVEGMFFTTDKLSWLENEEGLSFGGKFTKTVAEDVRSAEKKLVWALRFDSRLSPALNGEMSMQDALDKFVSGLADEAERIFERFDVNELEKNHLLLLPVFNKAKENGVVDYVVGKLELRRIHIERAQKLDVLIDILNDLNRRSSREPGESSLQEK